jgi:hypothetical protein
VEEFLNVAFSEYLNFNCLSRGSRSFETTFVKVSLLGVDSLWGDCTFIPAVRGSQQ